jgi:hypothetical protein
MPLHHSRKPLSFAEARHIHHITGFEEARIHFLAQVISFHALQTKFLQIKIGANARLLEVPGERFVHPLAVFHKETELEGVIPILLLRLLLDDGTGAGFDDRDGHDRSVFKKELGHSQFLADDSQRPLHLFSSSIPLLPPLYKAGRKEGLKLNLHIDPSRKIELHQGIDGLLGRLQDIEEALMGPDFELLSRFLVNMRRP